MFLAGFLLGQGLTPFLAAIGHWLAFAVRGVIGGRMVWEGFSEMREALDAQELGASWAVTTLTALAASLDSGAAGAGLALTGIPMTASLLIGAASFSMSLTAFLLAPRIGARLGPWAKVAGGSVLLAIGVSLIWEYIARCLG